MAVKIYFFIVIIYCFSLIIEGGSEAIEVINTDTIG